MFKKIALCILLLAFIPMGGCNDDTPKAPPPVVQPAPPPSTPSFLWLWLAVSPGVMLLVLLTGIHIGATGTRAALRGGA